MKKFLSLALALIMTLSLVTISAGAAEYKDFTDKDEIQYEEAVAVLNRLGIITGYSEGDFRPEGELTRGAAAKIIVSLLIGPEAAEALPTTASPYPDVPAGNVFAGYISYCKNSEIISGYNDGTFRPTGTLTGFAFSKMLLGALGYDSDIEKFTGSGWTVRVSALAHKAGLFDRISFNGGETVNRETACQLALNTLKATMVQYTGGMNITSSDGTSMVVNATREYLTSNQDYASHIDNRKVTDSANNKNDYWTVEFGEEHFKDLRMDRERENSDGFGRPSNEWSYKKVTIGTYPIAADFTYNSQVIHCVEGTTDAAKVRALGLNGYEVVGPKEATRDKQTHLWLNGYEIPAGIGKVADIADYTDNGTLVEIYVSDEDADFITDVVVVKTQLMEVKRVASDYVSLDLYDGKSDSKADEPVDGLYGYNSKPIDKDINDVEPEDDYYDLLKGLKAGDIVAVVPVAPDSAVDSPKYDVGKAYVPETATGSLSRVETYGKVGKQSAVNVTVGGTKYNIALWNKDLYTITGDIVKITKKDVTVYLDEFGNTMLATGVGDTSNWMVIKNYRQGLVNGVIVTYVNGWDIGGEELSLNIGGGEIAKDAQRDFKPGDLVHYTNDTGSNTAEWVIDNNHSSPDGLTQNRQEKHGVFDVYDGNRESDSKPYEIKSSNTTLRLEGFGAVAANGTPSTSDMAYIDNGIKFIYVSIDPVDGEVDGIEFVSGVKSATNAELRGENSAAENKQAQACVSLKTRKDASGNTIESNVVTDDSAVKAVVIKRESTDASVSNLLYISKTNGSATLNNGDIVYGYEVVMMGPGGKIVDDDMTIYSYKNLRIGDFARYSKATAPEGVEGVDADNFYDLRGYGVNSTNTSAKDTFGRSAAVMNTNAIEYIAANKYLVRLADYNETRTRSFTGDDAPKIEGTYPADTLLNLGDGSAKNLVNMRGAEWVDLRQDVKRIEDIDGLKDILDATNPKLKVNMTILFNDNPDSDDFRRVYLVVINGTSVNTGTPSTNGNVTITIPDGTSIADVYSGTVDTDKTYKPGDSFTVVLKPGYKFGTISGATLGDDRTTFTVNSGASNVSISILKDGNATAVTLTGLDKMAKDAKVTAVVYDDAIVPTLTFTAPEWAVPSSTNFADTDVVNFKYTYQIGNKAPTTGTETLAAADISDGTYSLVLEQINLPEGTTVKDVKINATIDGWETVKVEYKVDGEPVAINESATGNTVVTTVDRTTGKSSFYVGLPTTYAGTGTYNITGADLITAADADLSGNVTITAGTAAKLTTSGIKAKGTSAVVVEFTGLRNTPLAYWTITNAKSIFTDDGVLINTLTATAATGDAASEPAKVEILQTGVGVTQQGNGELRVAKDKNTGVELSLKLTDVAGGAFYGNIASWTLNIKVEDENGPVEGVAKEVTLLPTDDTKALTNIGGITVNGDLTITVTATPNMKTTVNQVNVSDADAKKVHIAFDNDVLVSSATSKVNYQTANCQISENIVADPSTSRAANTTRGVTIQITDITNGATEIAIGAKENAIKCADGSFVSNDVFAKIAVSGVTLGDASTTDGGEDGENWPDESGSGTPSEPTPATSAKLEVVVTYQNNNTTDGSLEPTFANGDTVVFTSTGGSTNLSVTAAKTASGWSVTGAPTGYTGTFDGSKLTLTKDDAGAVAATSPFGTVTATVTIAGDSKNTAIKSATPTWADGTDEVST